MKKRIVILILMLSLLAVVVGRAAYSNPTIWACSNHKPAHVATSIEELEELTRTHGCTGWYIVEE
jgi:hypothetical protein